MSLSISGMPTNRISDLFVQQTLLDQTEASQSQMLTTENELSSGKQLSVASQDPVAAMRIMNLQSLLDANVQMTTNVSTNQSYLSTTDSALSNMSNLLSQAQANALAVMGSSATAEQQDAAAQQIQQAIQELTNIGNQQFEGRYLFAGSNVNVAPFTTTASGAIQYNGNDQSLSSFSDSNQLFASNVSGDAAFGAISSPIVGTALAPTLSFDTPLADLRGGTGITLGSIDISDGSGRPSVVDLSSAKTIGDVAALISAHPPQGRTLQVNLTATGLNIQLVPVAGQSNTLSVSDNGTDTTASELGILGNSATGQIQGSNLNPTLSLTTPLTNVLGTCATAYVHSTSGSDAGFIVQAKTAGSAAADGTTLNGVKVDLVNDPYVAAGQEMALFSPGSSGQPGTVVVYIKAGVTTAAQVVNAINKATSIPFQAQLDPLNTGTGQGVVATGILAQSQGGSGTNFDQTSGMQIVNDGQTYSVNLANCKTVEDVLNAINGSGAGVLAQINSTKTGLQISSLLSGANFSIGENGGHTATQLGLRSLNLNTPLASLNFGTGVQANSGGQNNGTPAADFTITRSDGSQFNVSVAGLTTVGQVIAQINSLGGSVQAKLASYGNGIQLTDSNPGGSTISVTANSSSSAATDLGLVPSGQSSSISTSANTASTASVSLGQPDYNLVFTAKNPGTTGNVQIIFQNNSNIQEGQETASYNPTAGTLTFQIAPGATTANDIITALEANPAANAAFSASIAEPPGVSAPVSTPITAQSVATTGGATAVLLGGDANPQETSGVFNSLLRLSQSLTSGNLTEAERDINQLSQASQQLSFTQASLGAQEQALSTVKNQLASENTQLQTNMSNNADADLASVISTLTGQQVAFQASLETEAQMFKMTLLNYL